MMEEILNKLSKDQEPIALEIVKKAKEMGVDPRLALALAYRESGLNPNAKGTSGEIGLMQVMPSTAKGMGFTTEELNNPSKNIEIGLTYLKRGLEKFDGDQVLAVAGYNAGLDHPYFSDQTKPLPASTKEYIKGINNLGGFTATPASQEEGASDSGLDPNAGGGDQKPPGDDLNEFKMRMLMDAAGVAGGATAAKVADMGSGVIGGARDLVRASRSLPGALSVLQSMQGAAPTAMPGMPPQAMPPQGMPAQGQPQGMPRPAVGGPAGPVGGPASPLAQMGGSATANYGKAFGLTDIEANRALDMSKNPGGANDLITQRREAMQKIQQMGGGYVENPNYGGLMTPQQSVGGGPRASYVQAPGGMSPLPPSVPVSAAPPPPPPGPGPLAQAAGSVARGAGAVLRSPLTQGALGGLSIAESAQEADRRFQQKDMTGTGIAAAGGVGGLLQILPVPPQLKIIGAAVSAASPLTLYLRDNLRKQKPMPAPTEEEMLEAEKPAFGIYPKPMRRAPLRPRSFAPGENMPPVEFMQ